MTRRSSQRAAAILLAHCIVVVCPHVHAVDMFWSNSRGDGSGTFSTAVNWTESAPFSSPPPDANDVAHFGMTTSSLDPKTYTVTFINSPTNRQAIVEDDRVTFDLNSHVYTLTNTSVAMRLGTVSGRSGRLTVTDGAVSLPFEADLEIGSTSGASGVLTVGAGGVVIGSPDLIVGVNGSGVLNINNNGDVVAGDTILGLNVGSIGTATITGSGSVLQADSLTVGGSGSGALNITAGGRVDHSDGIIGDAVGSVGAVTVSGANSLWQMTQGLRVGFSGEGTLRIEAGGTVLDQVGLVKGSAVVTGGSTWIHEFTLNVGLTSTTTGELTIESGSHVQNGNCNLAISQGGKGIAIVRDSGTTWTNTEALNVGLGGEGDLTIESGAAVTSVGGGVARTGGSKGTARITGSTSSWTTSGDFFVGGGVGQLDINSGQLLLTNESDLIVGSGGSGKMTISSGGKALDAFETIVGNFAGSTGELTVTGSGSQLRTLDRLTVGSSGHGTLLISNGGRVTNDVAIISGVNSSVRVQGNNSSWTNGGVLNLFGNAALVIEDGGVVSSVDSNIGDSASVTAVVTVSDATWSNSGHVNVGFGGAGRLSIEAGGHVSNLSASIGVLSDSNGTVFVNGATSQWINSEFLSVGNTGQGMLDIAAGGAVASTNGFIGDHVSGIGAVTVAGTNSQWIASSSLFIGRFGQGAVDIGPGGLIESAAIHIGVAPGSLGNVLVDGPNARLTAVGTLSVGIQGTGVLNVTAGGRVSSSGADIGTVTGGTGTARVTGSGSLWTISDRLLVGGIGTSSSGGTATLRIQAGGAVNVAKDTVVYVGDQLILEGGTLSTTAISFNGGGTFAWTSGTLHVGAYRGNLTTPDDGILAPGNSIGETAIDGNYFQRSRGTLEIEIGGPASADLVDITGVADFSGNLLLKLLSGFVPSPASSFVVFDSRGINGAFLNVANGQRLTTAGGTGSFLVSYGASSPFNPNQVVLSSFLATGLPADYNQDGLVAAADYTVWRDNLGSSTALPNDDTTGVGPDDYTRWKANFGQTLGGGSGATAKATVPEPVSFILWCMGTLSLLAMRRADYSDRLPRLGFVGSNVAIRLRSKL